MILEKQKESNVMEIGDYNETIAMSLDMDSAQVLMQMLSKNLYSDAVGSTVRETCSNALDSHRRAKTDDPIIVSLVTDPSGHNFTVEDFGMGLDHDDVTNIISKYGKSTARTDAGLLGMMGLGFKAPLAYSSSFYFICRKNGTERKYMMYEGEEGNSIDILYETPTSERNGVKIIIPVKSSDYSEFTLKIKEQLAYFESVYFNLPNGLSCNIFRSDLYQVSTISADRNMHICLDNVYYPIDYSKLGISPIEVSIGLRFSLTDGIYPTPNRESIRYTQEAKKTILDRIHEISTLLVTQFNATLTASSNINEIFAFYSSSGRYITLGESKYNVIPLVRFSNVAITKPSLIGVSLLDLEALYSNKDCLTKEYIKAYSISSRKIKEIKKNYSTEVSFNDISDRVFLYKESISGLKKEYIKSLTDYYGKTYYILRKKYNYSLGFKTRYSYYEADRRSFYHILELKKYRREDWRQVIKEFQFIQSQVMSKIRDIDTMEIPQEWINKRKAERASLRGVSERRNKLSGEIYAKIGEPLERFVENKFCKFVPNTIAINTLHKYRGLTIYNTHDDNDTLQGIFHVKMRNIRVISISKREYSLLEELSIHNLMSYNKFMEGNNKPFKRIITAYLIQNLIKKYSNVFYNIENLSRISKSLKDRLEILRHYAEVHHANCYDSVFEAMLTVAEEHNLFDMTIYPEYLEIKDLLDKLPFLNPIFKEINYNNQDAMIKILIDLFKYYKYRIDYTNYHLRVKEMIDLDTIFMDDIEEKEEEIEELIKE